MILNLQAELLAFQTKLSNRKEGFRLRHRLKERSLQAGKDSHVENRDETSLVGFIYQSVYQCKEQNRWFFKQTDDDK